MPTKTRKTKTKRSPAAKKLFEFFRVLDKTITETKSDGCIVEPCLPLRQRATYRTVDKICAEAYGAGSFVALEVPETSGLPHSYWLIRVLEIDRRCKRRAYLPEEEKRALRQIRYFVPTEEQGVMTLDEGRAFWEGFSFEGLKRYEGLKDFSDHFAWQRAAEAANVAPQLRELPDPPIKKQRARPTRKTKETIIARRRRGGPTPSIVVDRAEEMIEAGDKNNKEIKQALVTEFRLSELKDTPEDWLEHEAGQAIKAAQARKRRANKKTTKGKTIRR